jgi:hypothetical protein
MPINLLPSLHVYEDLLRIQALKRKNPNWFYFARARDGLFSILRSLNFLNRQVVLIPTSLCEEAIKPYLSVGLQPVAYKIDNELNIDYDDLLYCLESYDVAILHCVEYYGWHQDFSQIFNEIDQRNILLVHDKAHCMFDPDDVEIIPVNKWVKLYSVRKFFPLPDGAILLTNQCNVSTKWKIPNIMSIRNLLSLFIRSVDINNYSSCKELSNLLLNEKTMVINENEISLECDRGMSFISNIIFSRINFLKAKQQRQKNARRLMLSVNKSSWATPFFSNITDMDTPYQFPIKVKNINIAVKHFCQHDIKFEQSINLPLNSAMEFRNDCSVGDNIKRLNQQVVSLPVHHYLTETDLQVICTAIEMDL